MWRCQNLALLAKSDKRYNDNFVLFVRISYFEDFKQQRISPLSVDWIAARSVTDSCLL